MADPETTITIKGKDETGPATKATIKNIEDINKALEKSLKLTQSQITALQSRAQQTNRPYTQLLQLINQNNNAHNKQLQSILNGTQATGKFANAVGSAAQALAGMALKYASVTAAAEGARRSFLAFAEQEKKLLLLQNQTRASTAEIDKFGKKMSEIGAATATTWDDTLDAANKLRTGLSISMDEAVKKATRMNVVAQAWGTTPIKAATLVTDYMRNLNIPAEKYAQTVEIINASIGVLGLNMEELTTKGGELAETFKDMGYKGEEGVASMQVQLAIASDMMGNTNKGAQVLINTLREFESAGFGESLGRTPEVWREEVKRVKAETGDLAGYVVGLLKERGDASNVTDKMQAKSALLTKKFMEEDDGRITRKIKLLLAQKDANQSVVDGQRIINSNAGKVETMTNALSGLSKEFGKLLSTMGVPQAIVVFTEKMRELGEVLKVVATAIKIIRGEGTWDDAKTVGNALITPDERRIFRPSKWSQPDKMGRRLTDPMNLARAFVPAPLERALDPAMREASERAKAERANRVNKLLEEEKEPQAGGLNLPRVPNFVPEPYVPLRFGGGFGGDGQDADVGSWGGNAAWDDIMARGRAGGANVEDRRDEGRGWRSYAKPFLKKAIPGSIVAETMKNDAQQGPGQHAIRTRLRRALGIEDPGEPAPWDRNAQAYRFGSALGGLTGQGVDKSQQQQFGGSMDARYLTAAYGGPGGGLGGGGGGGGGGGDSQWSPAGPGGPGRGTGYGPNGMLPLRTGPGQDNAAPADTAAPAGPEAGPGGVPVQPGTVAPNLPPELGGAAAAAPAAAATASGDYQGKRVNEDVMKTRIQQSNADWMKDPKNQQKIFRTLQAEGGGNIAANLEQMSNYAASRNLTLEQVVNARGKRQFYGPLRRFHGDPGSGPLMKHERDAYHSAWTPEKQKLWDKASKEVFSGGSNRINYLTDQGTVGDPNYDPNKMTKVGGNMFGIQPGTERWVGAQRGKAEVAGPVTVPGAAQTAAIPPGGAAQPLPPELGGPQPGAAPPAVTGQATGNRILPGRDLKGTDPRIKEILSHAAEVLPPGYKLRPTSGVRTSGQGQHTHGKAVDWEIVDDKGNAVRNRGDDTTGLYTKLAQAAYGYQEKYHKDLTGKFQWGGQFGTSAKNPNEPDLMHFDTGGRRGRISRYSRERIGAVLPPMPGSAAPVVASPPSQALRPTADMPPVQDDTAGASRPAQTSEELTSRNEKVAVNLKVNDNDVQFARSSMRRQADKEVREARWNSYSDIGAA